MSPAPAPASITCDASPARSARARARGGARNSKLNKLTPSKFLTQLLSRIAEQRLTACKLELPASPAVKGHSAETPLTYFEERSLTACL